MSKKIHWYLLAAIALAPPVRGEEAAVNAHFFLLTGPYAGDPTGVQIRDGELVSVADRDTFWIDLAGKPQLGAVVAKLSARWPDGTETPLGLNCARQDETAVPYTPTFGASTHTQGGRELVLERNGNSPWLPLRVGQPCSARVREVRDAGDTPLTPDPMVLSLGPTLLLNVPAAQVGDGVKLLAATEPDLTGVDVALGGRTILLRQGAAPDWGPAPQPRHPRTVIGWNDTHLFLIVVDGRRKGFSAGMTYAELSQLAAELGCTDALNLDGGGSSTLWLGGRVMNLPSDGAERPVANALVVVEDGAPGL